MQIMKNNAIKVLVALTLTVLVCVGLWGCSGNSSISTAPSLPDHFTVKERVIFKVKNSFDVEGDGANHGKVYEHLVQLTRSFTFEDKDGATVATASLSAFSWGTQINIVDGNGKTIGTIKEEVFSSLVSNWNTYKVLDASGKVVAYSKKSEFFATNITLENTSGKVVAELHRGAINWTGDSWSVTIKDRSAIDARILPFIAAYKTVSDNEKKSKDDGGTSDKSPSKK